MYKSFAFASAFFAALALPAASVASSLAGTAAKTATWIVRISDNDCAQRLYDQPRGRFGVFVFCPTGSTHGTLGIVNLDDMAVRHQADVPADAWNHDRRFWQDGPWVNVVSAFAWDPKTDIIYVVVGPNHERGAIYRVDMATRRHEKLFSRSDVDAAMLDWHKSNSNIVDYELWLEELDLNTGTIRFSLRLHKADGEIVTVAKKSTKLGESIAPRRRR